MLVKKSFYEDETQGVRMGNGKLSFGGVHLNVYSFYMDGVLIDTGAVSLKSYFLPYFARLKPEQIRITHYHEDHTGLASTFEHRVPIYMKDPTAGIEQINYPLYRRVFWGKRQPFQAQPLENRFQSPHYHWQVIDTPGHAYDHVAFLNEDTGQLFSGDLYCGTKTKVMLREESAPIVLQSLEHVLTYDFDEVFCNHAGHLQDGRKKLENKRDYLLEVMAKVTTLHEQGKGVAEITATLFPKKYPIVMFSRGEWGAEHIVRSIIEG